MGFVSVDLHPTVAEIMSRVASDTKPGARVCPYHLTSLRNRIRVPRFDSLRRFRDSVLRRSECRSILINAWMGHADREMSTRYSRQLLEDREYRREWCERVGLGFSL